MSLRCQSPSPGTHSEFATLVPPAHDAHLRVQRLQSGGSRVHFDLHSGDHRALAELATGLGAVLQHDRGYVVLRSPGGLEFCIVEHHGEIKRADALATSDNTGSYRVDQLCIDAAMDRFDEECKFWEALTGWERRPGSFAAFGALERPANFPFRILLQQTDDVGADTRVHLDIACAHNVSSMAAEHLELGAQLVRATPVWTTLRDHGGLEYCLTPRDPDTGLRS
jgi:Glyoxalase-like domain